MSDLEDVFEQIVTDALEDYTEDALEDIRKAFLSKEASDSAQKINSLFRKHKKPEVADPSSIADQVARKGDEINIKLDDDQRRFIAADELWNGSIGLKYTE